MTNIFVAKFDYGVKENELYQLFDQYGDVISCKIIIDKVTHKSKGFAFVEMYDDDAAQTAINELDGYILRGRAIAVSESRPRTAQD